MELESLTFKDVPYFSFEGITTNAKVASVYDGDTFTAIFMFRGEPVKYRCRCYGYDSPEMKPLLKNPNRLEIKAAALDAKNKFSELTGEMITLECMKFDKYGRILVKVYNDEVYVNDEMISGGYGKPYFGGKKV
jgi:endonuclease YncB( thermonuclease family)